MHRQCGWMRVLLMMQLTKKRYNHAPWNGKNGLYLHSNDVPYQKYIFFGSIIFHSILPAKCNCSGCFLRGLKWLRDFEIFFFVLNLFYISFFSFFVNIFRRYKVFLAVYIHRLLCRQLTRDQYTVVFLAYNVNGNRITSETNTQPLICRRSL